MISCFPCTESSQVSVALHSLLLLSIESTNSKPFLQNLVRSSNQHVRISSFSCVWWFTDMYLCAFYMWGCRRRHFLRRFDFSKAFWLFKGIWCSFRVIWKWLKLCSLFETLLSQRKKMSQTILKCLKVTENVSNYSARRHSKMTCTYVCMSTWSFYQGSLKSAEFWTN
jgi:hypothetical protein